MQSLLTLANKFLKLANQSNVIAHIAGPSGAGKSTLLKEIQNLHPNLITSDLDDFDSQAKEELGFQNTKKQNYSDQMLSTLAARRQELMDSFIETNTNKPILFAGFHTEGPHILNIPTNNRLLLNTDPLTSAKRGYLRDKTRHITDLSLDYQEAIEAIAELKHLGYKSMSADQIKTLITSLLKNST